MPRPDCGAALDHTRPDGDGNFARIAQFASRPVSESPTLELKINCQNISDVNLKAEALILAALGLRWPRVRGNENGGNVVLCLPDVRFSHTDHSG
jgi:hypothetical protein